MSRQYIMNRAFDDLYFVTKTKVVLLSIVNMSLESGNHYKQCSICQALTSASVRLLSQPIWM